MHTHNHNGNFNHVYMTKEVCIINKTFLKQKYLMITPFFQSE